MYNDPFRTPPYWRVSKFGHELFEVAGKLAICEKVGAEGHVERERKRTKLCQERSTNPLCYEFSECSTEEDFLRFANRHGLIHHNTWMPLTNLDLLTGVNEGMKPQGAPFCVNLDDIRKEHQKLRFVVVIWRLFREGRARRLQEVIKIDRNSSNKAQVSYRKSVSIAGKQGRFTDVNWGDVFGSEIFNGTEFIGDVRLAPEIPEYWEQPVRLIIQNLVNARLKQGLNFTLINFDKGLQRAVVPRSLMDLIWYDFFLYVSERRPQALCMYCEQYGEFGSADEYIKLSRRKEDGRAYHRRCRTTHVDMPKSRARKKAAVQQEGYAALPEPKDKE